ncbi:MAG: hypothetical protein ACE366_21025 [Bradymonadia bacterium]
MWALLSVVLCLVGCGGAQRGSAPAVDLTTHLRASTTAISMHGPHWPQTIGQYAEAFAQLRPELLPRVPSIFRPSARTDALGFDLADAGAWRERGFDAETGVLIALETLSEKAQMQLLCLMRLTDRAKFIKWLRDQGVEIVVVSQSDRTSSLLTINGSAFLMGTRGEITVISPNDGTDQAEADGRRDRFEAFLAHKAPALDADALYRDTFAADDGFNGRVYVNGARIYEFLQVGFPGAQWLQLVPRALGVSLDRGDTTLHIVNTPEVHRGLVRMFDSQHPAPEIAQPYMTGNGWIQIQAHINLEGFFEGMSIIGKALKVSPEQQIDTGLEGLRSSLPLFVGSSIEVLSQTFTGQLLFAGNLGEISEATDFGIEISTLLRRLQDAVLILPAHPKADGLGAFERLAQATGGGPGQRMELSEEPVLVFDDTYFVQRSDHLLAGPKATVETALSDPGWALKTGQSKDLLRLRMSAGVMRFLQSGPTARGRSDDIDTETERLTGLIFAQLSDLARYGEISVSLTQRGVDVTTQGQMSVLSLASQLSAIIMMPERLRRRPPSIDVPQGPGPIIDAAP